MRTGKLARALILALAVLAVLAAVAALDWYPTVKQLGILRRQRGDLELKSREYRVMAARFNFPGEAEKAILAHAEAELLRALPIVESENAWLVLAQNELLQREKGLANLVHLFKEAEKIGPGRPGLTAWLNSQAEEIRQGFQAADPWKHYPGSGVFPPMPSGGGKLACRPLGIALDASLPVLLNFINRISWGRTRLEIVRLQVELGLPVSRAWLVCRGSYLAPEPSPWLINLEQGERGIPLLIDSDSPLLWQKADPLFAPAVEKRELPPAKSPW